MFAGATAPCFSSFQDQSCLVAANCAGPHISGGLTSFLNTLMVSYFCRSLYARRAPEKPFVVIADEAQDLFASAVMREHLADAGRLSRRYGTFFWFITQNLSASISDTRLLRLLHTNTGWTWSGRGDPADNTFLKPVIPVTGRRLRPKRSPFEESSFYSDAEERALLLEEIANLPSRAGYFWPKGQSAEAIRVHTADLDIPQGSALEKAVLPMRNDPTVGDRISQQEYEKVLHRKTDRRPADEPGDLNDSLKDNYARSKSGKRKRS